MTVYQSVPTEWLYPLLRTGSGTASSQSSLHTWLTKIRRTWARKCSSFGVRCALVVSSGRISSCMRLKVYTLSSLHRKSLQPNQSIKIIANLTSFSIGLTLEQVDKLLVESTPRTSKNWVPTSTFTEQLKGESKYGVRTSNVEDVEKGGGSL